MATWRGSIQSPIVTQRYLNTAAYAGDPAPGALLSTAQVSGSIVQDYAGMVGGILTLNEKDANYYRDPASAALYAGDYQYVEFLATSTFTAEQGQVVFWYTVLGDKWIVTPDAGCAIAGIALCNTGKGKFWFIQVGGIAEVLFRGSLTKTTPVVCDLVYVESAGRHGDVIADATAVLSPQLKLLLGSAWSTAPVAGAISPVFLGIGPRYYPGG